MIVVMLDDDYIEPKMNYKNGILYVDVGTMSAANANKVMKKVRLGEFALQVFMAKMEWEETDDIH